MKKETLSEAIGRVDDALVEQAARPLKPGKKIIHWKRWAALAACLAVVVAGIASFPRMGAMDPGGGTTGGDPGSGINGGGTAFEFYCGPILPLTAVNGGETLTADRSVTFDFADGTRRVGVSDRYTLHNESEEPVTVKLLYPFVGQLCDVNEQRPELYVDGQAVDTVLHAGGYTGGFQGAGGPEQDLNLKRMDSWEEYKNLLSEADYLDGALSEHVSFSGIPVIVYRFDNAWGEEESKEIPNPTIRAQFALNYDETIVLSYGFHGGKFNSEAGEMGRDFSIPQPSEPRYGESCYLIVVGEDIENLTTQGYVTGGWDTTETIEYGVEIVRYETDLDTVLNEVFDLMYEDGLDSGSLQPEGRDLWYTLYCDHLAAYGMLSTDVVSRYMNGMLEDTDYAIVDRVFYLEVELTVPAGGYTTLLFNMEKEGSHHMPGGSRTEGGALHGYDLATQLGSTLHFERQSAGVINAEFVEIVNQNFGFDLSGGVTEVELDPTVERYYLEVTEK